MDYALSVRSVEGIGHGEGEVDEQGDVRPSASEPLLKGLTLEQFHGDERRVLADIVDGADIGVVEGGGGPGLPPEAFQGESRRVDAARKHLDRHHPIEPRVPGPIDLSHPAGAKRLDDFVGATAGAGREAQVSSVREKSAVCHSRALSLGVVAPHALPWQMLLITAFVEVSPSDRG